MGVLWREETDDSNGGQVRVSKMRQKGPACLCFKQPGLRIVRSLRNTSLGGDVATLSPVTSTHSAYVYQREHRTLPSAG
jgi:hypothetical protein